MALAIRRKGPEQGRAVGEVPTPIRGDEGEKWRHGRRFVVAYGRARRTNSDSCSQNQDKNRFAKRRAEN